MLQIAVLEDRENDRKIMTDHLRRFSRETGTEINVTHFENGLFFLEHGTAVFDIVFMDIEMPLMNGMEAARKMRQENTRSILIFTTNAAQYALQGYEVDAMDYLLKPVGYFNLSLKLRKAIGLLERSKEQDAKISVQTAEGLRIIPVNTLSYVEVQAHDLTYHADTDWTVRETMKHAEAALSPSGFMRCENSYLVNLRKVAGIDGDEVLVNLRGSVVRLPLSRRMKKDFTSALLQTLSGGGIG